MCCIEHVPFSMAITAVEILAGLTCPLFGLVKALIPVVQGTIQVGEWPLAQLEKLVLWIFVLGEECRQIFHEPLQQFSTGGPGNNLFLNTAVEGSFSLLGLCKRHGL